MLSMFLDMELVNLIVFQHLSPSCLKSEKQLVKVILLYLILVFEMERTSLRLMRQEQIL